jgi:hypothetical protein
MAVILIKAVAMQQAKCVLTRLEVFLTIELLTNLLQPYDSLKERRYLMNLAQKRGSSFLV